MVVHIGKQLMVVHWYSHFYFQQNDEKLEKQNNQRQAQVQIHMDFRHHFAHEIPEQCGYYHSNYQVQILFAFYQCLVSLNWCSTFKACMFNRIRALYC